MKRILLAAAAASLALGSASTRAATSTYQATLSGGGLHQYSAYNDIVTWTGTVSVTVDGSADGTYTGDTLEAIVVTSDWTNFDYTKGNIGAIEYPFPDLPLFVGAEPGAAVTITNGRLSGVWFNFDKEYELDSIWGLTASAATLCRINNCHGSPNNILLEGQLTPLQPSPVPEPGAIAMLLGGLALLRQVPRSSRR